MWPSLAPSGLLNMLLLGLGYYEGLPAAHIGRVRSSAGSAPPRRGYDMPTTLSASGTDNAKEPLLSVDFPDPSIIQDTDGT